MLITNDGKQDRMLHATDLLNSRIEKIKAVRAKRGEDPTPTLADIETTHILFMNAHFKPYAAIGLEYNKVISKSGTSHNYGSTVEFSIPQFGDFFGDPVVRCVLTNPQLVTPTVTDLVAAVETTNALVSSEDGVQDEEWTPAAGTVQGRLRQCLDQPTFRYCDFPGERLFKKVRFTVNGNPLDEYQSDDVIMYRKYHVPSNKRDGWFRLMGQQLPREARIDNSGCGFDITAYNAAVSAGTEAAYLSGIAPQWRYKDSVCDGLQTAKFSHGTHTELMIPILFWFRDPRLMIPSVAIPYGQRFISIDLEESNNMFDLTDGLTWLENCDTTLACNEQKFLFTEVAGAFDSTVTAQVKTMELYLGNVFVNPEIHDIFIKRIGFSLIRVHRQQRNSINESSVEILLQQLKWPIEFMEIGLRPTINNAKVAEGFVDRFYRLRNWHKFNLVETIHRTCKAPAAIPDFATQNTVYYGRDSSGVLNGTLILGNTAGAQEAGAFYDAAETCGGDGHDFERYYDMIDRMTISAHGIPLYNDFVKKFYTDYLPYNYGGYNITTPDLDDTLFVTFALYPGTYQPSGHINISRAREFYIKFNSDTIGKMGGATVTVTGLGLEGWAEDVGQDGEVTGTGNAAGLVVAQQVVDNNPIIWAELFVSVSAIEKF